MMYSVLIKTQVNLKHKLESMQSRADELEDGMNAPDIWILANLQYRRFDL